ncbi:3017_t:CDS:1 [Racocetra fulgida]|uniref:3017_t:CDS:1 n=1 Tax=Racocetra fulgida TaxID=60492 RepID=A0A9N9I8Z7_9GLOM|nr:3017_t:CDS:1 [Racocetra fulgida]
MSNFEVPRMSEVRCNCNRVVAKRISKTKLNPNRPYYKCDHCDFWEWEDKLTEINRNLRDITLISNSREMPVSITTPKAPPSLNNGLTNGLTNGPAHGPTNGLTNGLVNEQINNRHFSANLSNSSGESEVLVDANSFGQSTAVPTPANKQDRLIEAKKAENNFLRTQNEKMKNEIEKMKNDYDKMKNDYEKMKNDYEKMKKENEKMQNENEKTMNENEQIKQINDLLEKDKVGLSERITFLEIELKKKNNIVDTREIDHLRLQNKELDNKISDLNGKNAQLIRTNDDLTTKLLKETAKLNLKIGSLDREILDLRQRIKLKDEGSSNPSPGSEDIHFHKKAIEDNSVLKEQIRTTKQENSDLKEQIRTTKQENSDLKEQIRTIKQENSELKSAHQMEGLYVMIDRLTKRTNELSDENQTLVNENQELRQANNILKNSKRLKNNDL